MQSRKPTMFRTFSFVKVLFAAHLVGAQFATGSLLPAQETGDPASKISAKVLYHQRVKAKLETVAAAEQLTTLKQARVPLKNLRGESAALYVRQRLSADEVRALSKKGVRIEQNAWVPPVEGKHRFGFYLARIEYSALDAIASDPKVVRIASLGGALKPHNDLSDDMTEVTLLHQGYTGSARTGAGVKIAIADSGLDLSHPDIPEPAEAFDVTDGLGMQEWSTDVADHVTGHGTHVVGTAVGSGSASGGKYVGAAPGAELYFYKIGDDEEALATEEDIIEAILRASEVGCDIFSMSYGGSVGPLDGSDAMAQAIDVVTRRGMLCFISAGNEADAAVHHSIEVAPGTEQSFLFRIDNTDGPEYRGAKVLTLRWRDDQPRSTNIQLVAETLGSRESLVEDYSEASSRGTEIRQYTLNAVVLAGQHRTYRFRLDNLASGGETPRVHTVLWNSGESSRRGRGRFATPDPNTTVGSPAIADSAIAVGAWTQRCCWTNWRGADWSFGRLEGQVDRLAFFSSRGPRIDGRQKPEICAPGAATISCRDRSPAVVANLRDGHFVDDDGLNLNGSGPANYYVSSGTSMATPHAAGLAALLLEERPWSDPDQIKEAVMLSGRLAAAPTAEAGFGLINAVRAIDLLPATRTTTLVIDDSSYESEITAEAGQTLSFVQRLTPESYPATLSEVLVLLPYSAVPGRRFTLLVGTQPSNTEGVVPTMLEGVEAVARSSGELLAYNVPDFTIASGDLLVGYSIVCEESSSVASVDTDSPVGLSYQSSDGGEYALVGGTVAVRARLADAPRESAGDITTPLFLEFPETDVGLTETATFQVSNRGAVPLAVARVLSDSGQFEIVSPSDLVSIEPGGVTTVTVRFVPERGGAQTGTLRLVSDDPGEPVTSLLAVASAVYDPEIEVDVEAVDFGAVMLGESQEESVVVRNLGSTTLLIDEARILGFDRAKFSIDVPEESWILPPGDEREISVVFTPEDVQETRATLRIASNDADERLVRINLRGIGSVVPDIQLEREPIEFGAVALSESVERVLVVSNRGNAALMIASLSSSDPQFVVDPASVQIEPDAELPIVLRFSPEVPGPQRAFLTLITDDPDEPVVTVRLHGDGLGVLFTRGDCNSDAAVDISDTSCILNWLFLGGRPPNCVAATNTNGDATVDISDAVYIVTHLFLGGPAPIGPYPECGLPSVPADDVLNCSESNCL